MGVYGKLTAASEEALAAEKAREQITGSGVYGVLTNATGLPADVPAVPLEESPIGADYTIGELMAAVEGDPKLAKELVVTELKRPQGARKGALQYFAKLDNLDEATAKLVNDALDVYQPPE